MASKASIIGAGISLFAAVTPASAEGDPRRGADVYRACAACHSLEPGVHLTGPSLSGLIRRPVGKVAGFNRYSPDLRDADFEWEAGSLASFIENPPSMFPGTYMMFPGVRDAAAREDLVAFLIVATAPGGLKKAVEQGLITADAARGQAPPPLANPPPEGQVTAIRHCGDSFFITTADGVETPIWEKNVRIKIDSAETGPPVGVPVVLGAGMMGDRISVIFASLAEMQTFLEERC